MRIADFTTPLARLQDALEQLDIAWMHTREQWSDAVSDRIEEESMQRIRAHVRSAHEAASKLSSVANRAQRACEDPQRQDY